MSHDAWTRLPIGQLLSAGQYGLNLPATESGNVPIIGMRDITDGRIRKNDWGRVELNTVDKLRYLLNSNDLLLNRTNSFDQVGKVALWNLEDEAVFPSYIVRFSVNSRAANPSFLNEVLNSDDGQLRIKNLATRAINQANINPSVFKSDFMVSIPSLAEQDRIVTALSHWNRTIEISRQLHLLHEARASEFRDYCFADSFTKEPSIGWTQTSLGQLFIERDERGGSAPLLSITAENGIVNREEIGRRDTSADDKANYKRISPGEIGYNTMRMWQGVSAVSTLEGLVSPAYTVLRTKSKIDIAYAGHLFKTPRMIYLFWRYSQGLVDDTLNLKFPHFAEIAINVPSIQQQREIAAKMNVLLQSLRLYRTQESALRLQKRALARKLLSGEWRVPRLGDPFVPGGPMMDRIAEAAE